MNVIALAWESARRTTQSSQELPMETLGDLGDNVSLVEEVCFADDDGNPALCATRKFGSLDDIRQKLASGHRFYLYKLYELQKFGMQGDPPSVQPIGETFYHLRYCARA